MKADGKTALEVKWYTISEVAARDLKGVVQVSAWEQCVEAEAIQLRKRSFAAYCRYMKKHVVGLVSRM